MVRATDPASTATRFYTRSMVSPAAKSNSKCLHFDETMSPFNVNINDAFAFTSPGDSEFISQVLHSPMPIKKVSTKSTATSSRASKRRKVSPTESPAEVPKVVRASLLTPSPTIAVPSSESNKTTNTSTNTRTRTRKTRKLVVDESPAAEEDDSSPISTPITPTSKPKAKKNTKTHAIVKVSKKVSKKDTETLKPLDELDKATLLLTRLGLSSMLYHAIEPPRMYSWGKGGFLKLKNQSLHRLLHKKLTVSMDADAFALLLTAAKGKVRHARKEVKHASLKQTHATYRTVQVVPEIEDELIVTDHPAEQQQQEQQEEQQSTTTTAPTVFTASTATAQQQAEEVEYVDIVLAQSKRAVEAFVGPNGLPLYSVIDTVGPRTVQGQPKLIAVIDYPVVFTYSAAQSRMDVTLKYRWEESE